MGIALQVAGFAFQKDPVDSTLVALYSSRPERMKANDIMDDVASFFGFNNFEMYLMGLRREGKDILKRIFL